MINDPRFQHFLSSFTTECWSLGRASLKSAKDEYTTEDFVCMNCRLSDIENGRTVEGSWWTSVLTKEDT